MENLRIFIDYVHDLADYFEPGELAGIYLNFSDPWPKARHAKRRLTYHKNLANYRSVLEAGGFIEFKTDNEGLFTFTLEEIAAAGYSQVGLMGLVACQAAYEEGAEWLAQLKAYLEENRKFVKAYLEEHLPEIRLIEPEGTYLLWLDFKALHLNEKELEHLIVDKAHLWLDSGAMFGPDGEGFERINIACPRATVEKALKQLEAAIRG